MFVSCFTVFTMYCGLNSVLWGHLTHFLWNLNPKRTIWLLPKPVKLYSFSLKMLHFSIGQLICSLANFNLLSMFCFVLFFSPQQWELFENKLDLTAGRFTGHSSSKHYKVQRSKCYIHKKQCTVYLAASSLASHRYLLIFPVVIHNVGLVLSPWSLSLVESLTFWLIFHSFEW